MKISKYTFVLPQEKECAILFNCRTEALAVIENELAELLLNSTLDTIKCRHAAFFDFLKEKKFIVNSCSIEEDDVINDWNKTDVNKDYFGIFINPTLDCNLRCWYCFEKHVKGSLINQEIFSSIVNLIERKIQKEGVKDLSLSLFGGEPLIAFKSVVLPMIQKASKICIESQRNLYVSFVTNGTLITKTILKELSSIRTAQPISFQITLDGNEYFHNLTKKFPNGNGSFSLVMNNIRMIISYGMKVMLRLNMTSENANSFYDILIELKNMSIQEKSLLTIDLQHVWQDVSKADGISFNMQQEKMREAFISENFIVTELKHIDNSRCYADRENNVSINYDGSLYHCTAKDFSVENAEGRILSDGTLSWNHKHHKRMAIKYGDNTCKSCRIFPLCHGGCSQYKLDTEGCTSCIRGYDDAFKEKIVHDRVDFLLERITNNNKRNEEF